MSDSSVRGKAARVIERMDPNKRAGQVMVAVRGGTEAMNAHLERSDMGTYEVGDLVFVMEFLPPRTVIVGPDPLI